MDLVIGAAMMSTVLLLAVPIYADALESAKETIAVQTLEELREEIELYRRTAGSLPANLHDLDNSPFADPWGNKFHYAKVTGLDGGAKKRTRLNMFLKPLNSEYDLYSSGPDGRSAPPLTARASRDDIVLARDGEFIGVARDF